MSLSYAPSIIGHFRSDKYHIIYKWHGIVQIWWIYIFIKDKLITRAGLCHQKKVSQVWKNNCIPQNTKWDGCKNLPLPKIPASVTKVLNIDQWKADWFTDTANTGNRFHYKVSVLQKKTFVGDIHHAVFQGVTITTALRLPISSFWQAGNGDRWMV